MGLEKINTEEENEYRDGDGLKELVNIIASLRKDVDKLLKRENQSISITINSTEPQSVNEFAEKLIKALKKKSFL